MGKREKKRSHAQYAQDLGAASAPTGISSTLALPPDSELQGKGGNHQENNALPGELEHEDGTSVQWEVVDRRSRQRIYGKEMKSVKASEKRNERKKDNRPALTYTELHKMQSSLKIADIQSLVLYCLADGTSPQWVSVKHHNQVRKAVVLLVPGLERHMFDSHIKLTGTALPESLDDNDQVAAKAKDLNDRLKSVDEDEQVVFHSNYNRSPDDYLPIRLQGDSLHPAIQPLADVFSHVWPVRAPGDDRYCKLHSPLHAMLNAPVPKSQEEKSVENGSKGLKPVREGRAWKDERTTIITFLASAEELQENGYTLHPTYFKAEDEVTAELTRRERHKQTETYGWRDTNVSELRKSKIANGDITEPAVENRGLPLGWTALAIDCEMCRVEGDEMALTRISIVGWDGELVIDELVKPDKPVIDYLTPYSGITAAKLEAVTTNLSDIQSRLLTLLTPNTILLGHSLNADLDALKLTHPFIIDTSLLYPHPRGPPLKSSLKFLAQKYLSREIQKGHGSMGHDSIEDARACLDLVKQKCEKGPRWGTGEGTSESIFKRLARTARLGPGSWTNGVRDSKRGAIVDHGAPERSFGLMAGIGIGCKNDQEVVNGVKRALWGDSDGLVVPGGGVEFTWGRLRELEVLRGWSNDNRHLQNNSDDNIGDREDQYKDPTPALLAAVVTQTVKHIVAIHAMLPPCTLLVVYTGTGDPRELARLQGLQRVFKREYSIKKWDELSVKWTDREEQALRKSCKQARDGLGLITIT